MFKSLKKQVTFFIQKKLHKNNFYLLPELIKNVNIIIGDKNEQYIINNSFIRNIYIIIRNFLF